MARIRSVKPEYWTSEQVMQCSRDARLLFVGMWNFCDANGVHPAAVLRLKCEVLPGDPVSVSEVRAWIDELIAAGLIVEYEVDGKAYWQVLSFAKHQIIKEEKAKYPTACLKDLGQKVVQDCGSDAPAVEQDCGNAEPRTRKRTRSRRGISVPNGTVTPETAEPSSAVVTLEDREIPELAFDCDGSPQRWCVTESMLAEWSRYYPTLDIRSQTLKALAWTRASPENRKTARGMKKFLVGWFNRTNDRGDRRGQQQRTFGNDRTGPSRQYDPSHAVDADAWGLG